MRESEEYLDNNWTDTWTVKISDAEHAVKLAYKEGYLEAIDKVLEILNDGYGFTDGYMIQNIKDLKK